MEELTAGQKRAKKILERDPDHFKKAGKKGGAGSNKGGFSQVPGLAKEAINKRWAKERAKKNAKSGDSI